MVIFNSYFDITRGYFIGEDSWNPWQPYFSDLPNSLPHGMIIFVKKPVGSLVNSAFLIAFGRGFPQNKNVNRCPGFFDVQGPQCFEAWKLETKLPCASCGKSVKSSWPSQRVTGYYSIAHTTCDIPIGLYCGYWTPHLGWWKKKEKKKRTSNMVAWEALLKSPTLYPISHKKRILTFQLVHKKKKKTQSNHIQPLF